MKLIVTTLKGIVYEGDIISLNVKTTSGEITVLDNHRPLVTILKNGDLHIVSRTDEQKTIPVSSGFLEIRPNNEVSVILN